MSKNNPHPSIDATAERWNMVTGAAHAAAVPAALGFGEEHVSYIARYGGNCRDCADASGVCPNRGLPCADSRKAIRFVLDALAYGLNHGYIAALATGCRPSDLVNTAHILASDGPGTVVQKLDVAYESACRKLESAIAIATAKNGGL